MRAPTASSCPDWRTIRRSRPWWPPSRWPLNLLPGIGLDRLAELGVRRVSTGSPLFRAALYATAKTAIAVRDGLPLPAGIPGYAENDALNR
ncbi:MAG: hypothetical protein ABIQ18_02785 [Umezawaea sp.]